MIWRLFDFGETTVREVMVPLVDVVGVERGASGRQAAGIAKAGPQAVPV
jgi:CBS domain containing-hemolysin-like protein